jgi:hypothetical protein
VGVAVADGLAVGGRCAHVEGQLIEAGVVTGVRRDALLSLEGGEDIRGETRGEVDLALDEGLAEGVGVVVDPEDELVDLGSAGVVAVVGDEATSGSPSGSLAKDFTALASTPLHTCSGRM